MKLIIAALVLISTQSFASVYTCDADFIVPKEDSTTPDELTTLNLKMVVSEVGAKRVATVTMGIEVLVDNQELTSYRDNKPHVEMIQQLVDISVENQTFAQLVKQLYGDSPEKILKETVATTLEGFEGEDSGAYLGYHYDKNGKIVATELSVAWLGTAICK